MIRYLPGIILIQLVTFALLWVNRAAEPKELLTLVALPACLLSLVTALWFSAISRSQTHKAHSELVEKHFKEREKLTQALERQRADVMQKASADQAKLIERASSDQAKLIERASSEREKLVQKTHRDMIKAERRASRSANMKVGAAFSLVTVAGVGLLFIQFMTLGLLTITAASGALGGYLLRWKQTRNMMQLHYESEDAQLPDSKDNPRLIGKGSSAKKSHSDNSKNNA